MNKCCIRIVSLLLALALTVGLVPVRSHAFAEEDIPYPGDPLYVSEDEAALALRSQMQTRQETAIVYVHSYDNDYEQLYYRIMDKACAHDGTPTGGDYLLWHRIQYGGAPVYGYQTDTGNWFVFIYPVVYYDTAEQQTEMDEAIDSLLEELALDGKSDYEKVLGVYDYMTRNITYDYDNLNDETYHLKHSAYAALIHKTAVCQGYATLFYRLMLELGVDCRFISGIGITPSNENGDAHGWNIVKLDGKYYNVDATWDAEAVRVGLPYQYFLRADETFEDHYRDAQYDSEEFRARYPMAQTDYVPEEHPQVLPGDVNGNGTVDGNDATVLLQYAAGWDVEIKDAAADVNADGTIDGHDATLLLQYAAGWDVELKAA